MLGELIEQVDEITVGKPARTLDDVLRGLRSLPASFIRERGGRAARRSIERPQQGRGRDGGGRLPLLHDRDDLC